MININEITNEVKVEIDNLIESLHIKGADLENCGKIKRCVHVLFKNDNKKRQYFIYRIAQENLLISVAVTKEILHENNIKAVIQNVIINNKENNILTILLALYLLGEYDSSKPYLMKYVEQFERREDFKVIQNLFSQEELWNFMSFCIDNLIELQYLKRIENDRRLSYIISKMFYNNDFLDKKKNEFKNLYDCLVSIKYIESKNALVRIIGIDRLLETYGYSYETICEMIDDFPEEKRIEGELNCCEKLYKCNEKIYEKFRERYYPINKKNIKWIYLSLFAENIRKRHISEILENSFEELKLKRDLISSKIVKDEQIFVGLAMCIYNCLVNDEDIFKLLNLVEPINGCKNKNPITIPYFEYKKKKMIRNDSTVFIEKYAESKQDLHKLLFVYFNSYLKYTVDLNLLIKILLQNDYKNDDVNNELSNYKLYGKVKFKEGDGLSISIRTATVKSYCRYKDKSGLWKKFNIGDKVALTFQNNAILRKLEIISIWDLQSENTKIIDEEMDWKDCIKMIGNLSSKKYIQADTLKTIKKYIQADTLKIIQQKSEVRIGVVQKYFEDFTICLESICHNKYMFMRVLSNLKWNFSFINKNDLIFHGLDYSFAENYEDRYYRILEFLLKTEIEIRDMISIYTETFIKAIIPINRFIELLLIKYEMDIILIEFKKYSFYGIARKEESVEKLRVKLLNIKSERQYWCNNDKIGPMFFIVSSYSRKDNVVEFEVDEDKTKEILTKINVDSLLRRVKLLAEEKRVTKTTIRRLKEVSFEQYENNIDVCIELAEYVKKGIYNRRYSSYEIIDFIKVLSFRNPYCARRIPIYKSDYFSTYRKNIKEIELANKIADIVILNTNSISSCFFIYINSFLKVNISVYDYLAKCNQNASIEKSDFELLLHTIGIIDKKVDCRFIPTDISTKDSYELGELVKSKDIVNKKVCGVIRIFMKNKVFFTELKEIIELE